MSGEYDSYTLPFKREEVLCCIFCCYSLHIRTPIARISESLNQSVFAVMIITHTHTHSQIEEMSQGIYKTKP